MLQTLTKMYYLNGLDSCYIMDKTKPCLAEQDGKKRMKREKKEEVENGPKGKAFRRR